MKSLRNLILFSVMTLGITNCGGDEEVEQNDFYIVGEWRGDWQGGTVNGSAISSIKNQDGGRYVGTSYLDGNPCVTDSIILGHIDLETGETTLLALDPNLSEEELQTFDPQDPDTYLLREHVIEMKGAFSRFGYGSLEYNIIEWSYCDGATGILNMTRE